MTSSRRAEVLVAVGFALVLGWQAGGFALETVHERWPGSAYAPRVDALLAVCANAATQGPFAVVPVGGGRYSLATIVIGDVGHAGLVDVICRIRRGTIGRRGLGWIVLGILLFCAILAFWAGDFLFRVALAATLASRTLSIVAYRNVDTVSLFGALVLAAAAVAILATGRRGLAGAALGGVLCVALYAERSIFAYFAVVMAVTAGLLPMRRIKPLAIFLIAALISATVWRYAVERRQETPGIVEQAAISAHNTWGYLVTGIGFSPNPWGIRASDPAVVEFLARFAGGPPLTMEHPENEARAKRFMLRLVSREPLALLSVYAQRAPAVVSEFFSLSWFGVALVVVLAPFAWRRSSESARPILIIVGLLCVCLGAQAVILDPRQPFSDPLLIASTLLQFGLVLPLLSKAAVRGSTVPTPSP